MIRHSLLKSEVQTVLERYRQERLLRLMRHKEFVIVLEHYRTKGMYLETDRWSLFGRLYPLCGKNYLHGSVEICQSENDASFKILKHWINSFPQFVPNQSKISLLLEITSVLETDESIFSFGCYLASVLKHPRLDKIGIVNTGKKSRLYFKGFKNGNIRYFSTDLAPLKLENMPLFKEFHF